jgi:hypothetical protein
MCLERACQLPHCEQCAGAERKRGVADLHHFSSGIRTFLCSSFSSRGSKSALDFDTSRDGVVEYFTRVIGRAKVAGAGQVAVQEPFCNAIIDTDLAAPLAERPS